MEPKRLKTSDLSNLKKLIGICEKASISRIKFDNFEIEFFDGVRKPEKKSKGIVKKQQDELDSDESLAMPPDDVMMFAATPHFESLLDKKGK